MSVREELKGLVENTKDKLTDVMFDRLRSNFYGYLLTSLFLFNLENLFLIFKSKEPIEITLIYIGLQKNFICNFFWLPILCGVIASLIMPFLTAAYALAIGVLNTARNDTNLVGASLWSTFKIKIKSRDDAAKQMKRELEEELAAMVLQRKALDARLETLQDTKSGLEKYISTLASVFGVYRNNVMNKDLQGFLQALDDADVIKHFPSEYLLRDALDFINIETQKNPDSANEGCSIKSSEENKGS